MRTACLPFHVSAAIPFGLVAGKEAIQLEPLASLKADPTMVNTLIISSAVLIGVGLIAASIVTILIGRAAYASGAAPDAARSFGLFFLTLPAVITIVFIVLATATLTAMNLLPQGGCVAIFSSIASYVLGSEIQKRREAQRP
jgi:hypothetical protein